MNNSIIVYRSQTEQNADYFFNQMVYPWMYEHWYLFVIFIILGIGYTVWQDGKKRY